MAKTTSCPAAASTCQLTATSVGSKSAGRQRHQDGHHRCDATLPTGTGRTRAGSHEHCGGAGFSVDACPIPAPLPEPIFSPEDGLEELWVKAYQGEVLGEALFGGIAEQLDDPEHAAKMRVLATLERRTKEATAPALERAGVPTEPDPEMQVMADGADPRLRWT